MEFGLHHPCGKPVTADPVTVAEPFIADGESRAKADSQPPYRVEPSGLHGKIADVTVHPLAEPKPLPKDFTSPDVDLTQMARWSMRHLNKNPRANLNYEPVFYVRPMHVPPAPDGHDA